MLCCAVTGEEGCDITSAINAGADTLVFKRLILRQGEARFQVNGEIVSQADYHKRLEGINILSKVLQAWAKGEECKKFACKVAAWGANLTP